MHKKTAKLMFAASLFLGIVLFSTVIQAAPLASAAPAAVSQQTQASCDKKTTFFGLVPWYQYLTLELDKNTNNCKITNFDDEKVLGASSPVLLIALAILDNMLRIIGLVSVGFIIFGGFQYMTSQGSPDSTKQAQQTIINALIGLVIALIATGLVSFIGTKLGGS